MSAEKFNKTLVTVATVLSLKQAFIHLATVRARFIKNDFKTGRQQEDDPPAPWVHKMLKVGGCVGAWCTISCDDDHADDGGWRGTNVGCQAALWTPG